VIERPKRAVTRFFIPLIDVLILLFCIFLLLPFTNQPGTAKSADNQAEEKKEMTREELLRENAGLRLELAKAQKDIRQLQEERTNPAEKVAPFVIEIEPSQGHLIYYSGGKARRINDQRDAQEVIDQHKRRIGIGKDPLFIIMMPRQFSVWPSAPQLAMYQSWFKDVPAQINNPLAPDR
jgi:hypothetical protein